MIETERVVLRGWQDTDVPHHNAMCTDTAFMAHLGPPITMAESAAAAARQNAHLSATGSCFWALEHRASRRFVGYCGIKPGPDDTPIDHPALAPGDPLRRHITYCDQPPAVTRSVPGRGARHAPSRRSPSRQSRLDQEGASIASIRSIASPWLLASATASLRIAASGG